MKLNRSLAISTEIQKSLMAGNIITALEKEFPSHIVKKFSQTDSEDRDRVYPPDKTLLLMVLTAVQEDKSQENTVDLYYAIHQKEKDLVLDELKKRKQNEQELDKQKPKRAGRPKLYSLKIPKSLEKEISLNTAGYSKARKRLPLELVNDLFKHSQIDDAKNDYTHWHGMRVLIGDGTYVQMADTEPIRKEYAVKHKGKESSGYPQGLLEVLIERGTGQITNFKLANRHVSELELMYNILDEVPSGTLLLLDDLYNCYEIISKCLSKGIHLVIPSKRKRNYELVETLSQGDEIIKIKTHQNRSKWLVKNEKPNSFLLRRITCKSPDGNEYVLFTTVLDKKIKKEEFQLLYLTRWDVEIGIREIKTIMGINILRSKTPEMVLKELTVSLATYNLLRKIIYASLKNLPFSPKEDFIQEFYTLNKTIFIDKKGRVYSRWSTGRKRAGISDKEPNIANKKAKQKV
jgi:hypothetical protein